MFLFSHIETSTAGKLKGLRNMKIIHKNAATKQCRWRRAQVTKKSKATEFSRRVTRKQCCKVSHIPLMSKSQQIQQKGAVSREPAQAFPRMTEYINTFFKCWNQEEDILSIPREDYQSPIALLKTKQVRTSKRHTRGNIHWDHMTRLRNLTSLSSLVYFDAWMKATARALGLHEQE